MGYGNSMENLGQIPVPDYALGFNHSKDPFIQRNKQKYSSFTSKKRNNIISITSDMISTLIQDGVETTGKTKLGILQSEIGTHSIRSGAAMSMYLAGCCNPWGPICQEVPITTYWGDLPSTCLPKHSLPPNTWPVLLTQ
jgi:hypothetical protein